MEKIFLEFVNQSISAGWIVLAVILLRVILKKAPKWIICIFWGIVGLRLELPFTLKSYFSLVPSTDTVPTTFTYDVVPKIHTGINDANSTINPILQNQYDKAQISYYAQSTYPPEGGNSFVDLLSNIAHIGAIVWIAGVVLMFLYMLISYVKIHLKIRTATHFKDNIYESEFVSSPFIFGIYKPKIYIPYNLNGSDFANVIAHEKAHISRYDPLFKIIGYIILSLYWFNPLMWVAYILLCRDIEFATDEKVIKKMNCEERKSYLLALLNCSTLSRFKTASPLAFGEVGVKERVLKIKFYKKTSFWLVGTAIVLCVATALCFLTSPELQQASQKLKPHENLADYLTCPATEKIPDKIEKLAQKEEDEGKIYSFIEKVLADVDGDDENELICRATCGMISYVSPDLTPLVSPDLTLLVYEIKDNRLEFAGSFYIPLDLVKKYSKRIKLGVDESALSCPTLRVNNNKATVMWHTPDEYDIDVFYDCGIEIKYENMFLFNANIEVDIGDFLPRQMFAFAIEEDETDSTDITDYLTCNAFVTDKLPSKFKNLNKQTIMGDIYELAFADVDGDNENELICNTFYPYSSGEMNRVTISIYKIKDYYLVPKYQTSYVPELIEKQIEKMGCKDIEICDHTLRIIDNKACICFCTPDEWDTDIYHNTWIEFCNKKLYLVFDGKRKEIARLDRPFVNKLDWDNPDYE